MDLKRNPIPLSRGNDEVTDKGTQRERHKVFGSIWDEFYGEVD